MKSTLFALLVLIPTAAFADPSAESRARPPRVTLATLGAQVTATQQQITNIESLLSGLSSSGTTENTNITNIFQSTTNLENGLKTLSNQIATQGSWDKIINDSSRFTVLAAYNNQAVLDNETGLVWELQPQTSLAANWGNAAYQCTIKKIGNRFGWRLPRVEELNTLIDPTQVSFVKMALPVGNPFQTSIANGAIYWSASSGWQAPTDHAIAVDMTSGGGSESMRSSNFAHLWCVRGGIGGGQQ